MLYNSLTHSLEDIDDHAEQANRTIKKLSDDMIKMKQDFNNQIDKANKELQTVNAGTGVIKDKFMTRLANPSQACSGKRGAEEIAPNATKKPRTVESISNFNEAASVNTNCKGDSAASNTKQIESQRAVSGESLIPGLSYEGQDEPSVKPS